MRNVTAQAPHAPSLSEPLARPSALYEEMSESRLLAMRVQRGILRLAPCRIRDLKVEVRRGSVVLTGRCGSFYSKQLAQTAALELAGGALVVNQIEVAG